MIRNQNQKLIFMVVIGFFLSFSFVSAKNFTIFNATNVNQPYFSVNGTSGYVGVGTTNPDALFNIKQPNDNDTSANGFRLTNFDGSSYFNFYINSVAGGGNPRFSTNKSLVFEAGSAIFLRSSGTTYFNDGTPRNTNFNNGQLYLQSGGNFGILTTTPAYKLDVNGTAQFNNTVIVGTPTATNHATTKSYVDSAVAAVGGGVGTGTSGQTLRNNGTSWVANSTLYNNGTNIGIGTTGPTQKLDVNGGMHLSLGEGLDFVSNGDYYGATADARIVRMVDSNGTNGGVDGGITFERYTSTDSVAIDVLTLRGSGNVGIGTISPVYKLDVNGSAQFNSTVIVGTPTASNHAATKSYVDSAAGGGVGTGISGQTLRHNGTNWVANSLLYNNGTNVGIGTTNPRAKLDIYGTVSGGHVDSLVLSNSSSNTNSGTAIYMGYQNSGLGYYGARILQVGDPVGTRSSDLLFQIHGGPADNADTSWVTPLMIQKTSGNIGIGTVSPTYKLDVNGTAQFNQPVIVGTPTATNHATTKSYVDSALSGGSGSTVGYWSMNGTNISNTNAGNVGIGTNSPRAKLDVMGLRSSVISTSTAVSKIGGNDVFVYTNALDTASWGVWMQVLNNTNSPLPLLLNPIGGNVGIGTTTPAAMLDVQGTIRSSAGKFSVDNPGNITAESFYDLTNALYKLDPSNTNESMKIAGTIGSLGTATNNYFMGNVGVGTTAPSQQLEITKNFRMPSTLYTNGSYGVIYKDGYRFIHDFNYGNNGTVTTSGRNTFLGINAGNFTMGSTATSGSHASYNTGIGYQSLLSNTNGYYNSALGYISLYSNTTGNYNSAISAQSLYSNTTGNYNSALGYASIYSNITGSSNSALGYYSLYSNVAGNYGVAIGYESQKYANSTTTSWNNSNTSVGMQALRGGTDASLNTGASNSVLGYQAMVYNTSGSNNSVVGSIALQNNSTGSYNSVLGYQALYSNTTGNYNSAVGMYSLLSNISGSNNTAIGISAGRYIADGSTGKTTGNYSLYLGYNSKAYANGTNNENVIGYNAVGLGSNTVVLGNDSIVTTALKGNVGIGTTTPQSTLDVNGIIKMRNATITQPEDVINKSYLDSALDVAQSAYWNLSGSNLYTASTSWNVGIGTTAPKNPFQITPNSGGASIPALGTIDSGTGFYLTGKSNPAYGLMLGVLNSGTGWVQQGRTDATATAYNFLIQPLGGNVGIGTVSPAALLDIIGKVKVTSGGTIYNTDSSRWLDMTGTLSDSLKVSGDLYSTAGELKTDGAGINYMMGSLGVGLNNPMGKLHIANTAGEALAMIQGQTNINYSSTLRLVENNTYLGGFLSYNGDVNILNIGVHSSSDTATSSDLNAISILREGGNVGIGTTAPADKLHVIGNATISGLAGCTGTGAVLKTDASGRLVCGTTTGGVTGSGTTNYVTKWTGTNTLGTGVLYDNGTDVGIGTTVPGAKLSIAQNMSDYNSSFTSPHLRLQAKNIVDNTGFVGITYDSSTSANYGWSSGVLRSNNGQSSFVWKNHISSATGTEYMRIANNGYVGIGTTNPNQKLEIAQLNNPTLRISNTNSSVLAGTEFGRIEFFTADSSLYGNDVMARIRAVTESENTDFGNLSFQVRKTGDAGAAPQWNDAMYMKFNGNVGIGTTTPTFKLDVNGTAQFNQPVIVGTPTAINHAATKSYVDSTAASIASSTMNSFWLASGSDIYNANSGNIGIGTTTPSAALDVFGKVKITSGGTIYNTNSGRWLDMTGVLTDSLRVSGNLITTGGSVGIGTANVDAKLSIAVSPTTGITTDAISFTSSAGALSKIQSYNAGSYYQDLIFTTSNGTSSPSLTSVMTIKGQTGNVGIGTTTPNYKLDVNGTGRFMSALYLGNTGSINLGVDPSAANGYFDIRANGTGGYGFGYNQGSGILAYYGGTTAAKFSVSNTGLGYFADSVGIGTANPTEAKLVINAGTGMAVKAYGDGVFTGTLQTQTGADFAEEFATTYDLEPGTVVVMGDDGYKSVRPCDKSYDKTVVGVVSNNPSIIAGKIDSKHKAVVAMMGVVKVKVIDINGKVTKGDMLTTSGVSGYAMKADGSKPGTIIGKALEDLNKKSGEINVLVNLQ